MLIMDSQYKYSDSTSTNCLQILQQKQNEYTIKLWTMYPQLQCCQKKLKSKDILQLILKKYTKINKGIQSQLQTANKSTLTKLQQLFQTSLQTKNYSIDEHQKTLVVCFPFVPELQLYISDPHNRHKQLQIAIPLSKTKENRVNNIRNLIMNQLVFINSEMQTLNKDSAIKQQLVKYKKEQQLEYIEKRQESPLHNHRQMIDQINQIMENIGSCCRGLDQLDGKLESFMEINNVDDEGSQQEQEEQEQQQQIQISGYSKRKYQKMMMSDHRELQSARSRKRMNIQTNGRQNIYEQSINDEVLEQMQQTINLSSSNTNKKQKSKGTPPYRIRYKRYSVITSSLKFISNPFSNPTYFSYKNNVITKIWAKPDNRNDKTLIIDDQMELKHDEDKIVRFLVVRHEEREREAIQVGVITKTFAISYPTENRMDFYSSLGELNENGRVIENGNGFTEGNTIQIKLNKISIQWKVNGKITATINKNIKRSCSFYPIIMIGKVNDSIQYQGSS